jgi:hypothetical protein
MLHREIKSLKISLAGFFLLSPLPSDHFLLSNHTALPTAGSHLFVYSFVATTQRGSTHFFIKHKHKNSFSLGF